MPITIRSFRSGSARSRLSESGTLAHGDDDLEAFGRREPTVSGAEMEIEHLGDGPP